MGSVVMATGDRSLDDLPRFKVEKVEATQAYAKRIGGGGLIEAACLAELVRPVIRRPLHVRIQDPDLLEAAREKLREEGPGPFNPIFSSIEDGPDTAYQGPTINSSYQIADSHGNPLKYCHPVSGSDKEEAATIVCTRLRCLARYFFAMELINKSSTLDNKFSFTVTPSEIYNNEMIEITYKNLSDQPLHFTLLSLTAQCQVRVIGSEVTLGPNERNVASQETTDHSG
jgi:hypothetical protein